jgi:hypothetical protein
VAHLQPNVWSRNCVERLRSPDAPYLPATVRNALDTWCRAEVTWMALREQDLEGVDADWQWPLVFLALHLEDDRDDAPRRGAAYWRQGRERTTSSQFSEYLEAHPEALARAQDGSANGQA